MDTAPACLHAGGVTNFGANQESRAIHETSRMPRIYLVIKQSEIQLRQSRV
jgi:hypothetical protein